MFASQALASFGFKEIYDYSANGAGGAGTLTCVSCNPTGAVPLGSAFLDFHEQGIIGKPPAAERAITADASRIFFETEDALVPQDTNRAMDVYEWEQEGTGSCPAGSTRGCVYLISSGTSPYGSQIVDNSADGRDVFFLTADSLVPGDTDGGYVDVYDARIAGGFPASSAPAGCQEDHCQGAPSSQPVLLPPTSAFYTGGANLTPPVSKAAVKPKAKPKPRCKRGYGRNKHGKCAKVKKRAKRPSKRVKGGRI